MIDRSASSASAGENKSIQGRVGVLEVYMIRHGQTDYNLKNIVQGGGIDSDLNETGLSQGRKFWEKYRDVEFDGMFSSGLKRSYQTIQFFEGPGNSIIKMPEFNEFNWGIMEGKVASPALHEEFKRINLEWESGNLHAGAEGGESPLQAWDRVEKGILKLQNLYPEGGRILLCTHGRLLKLMLAQLLEFGMERMNHFPHENTALNLIHLSPEGKAFAEALNNLSHLEE